MLILLKNIGDVEALKYAEPSALTASLMTLALPAADNKFALVTETTRVLRPLKGFLNNAMPLPLMTP
jgi:hypothetical protein